MHFCHLYCMDTVASTATSLANALSQLCTVDLMPYNALQAHDSFVLESGKRSLGEKRGEYGGCAEISPFHLKIMINKLSVREHHPHEQQWVTDQKFSSFPTSVSGFLKPGWE